MQLVPPHALSPRELDVSTAHEIDSFFGKLSRLSFAHGWARLVQGIEEGRKKQARAVALDVSQEVCVQLMPPRALLPKPA